MNLHLLVLIAGAAIIVAMIELLRRQRLKERYTVLWFIVGIWVAVLALFPGLLNEVSDVLGVKSGPNMLFLIAISALGLVCIHLSVEVTRLDDRTRCLAEEVALLNVAVRRAEPSAAEPGVPGRGER